jgi:membrane protein
VKLAAMILQNAESPKKLPVVESTKNLIGKSIHDDIITLAASLAFYTVLAISPLIVLMITFISSLNLSLQEQLIFQVEELMGPEASSVLTNIIASSAAEPAAMTTADAWSFAVLAVSSSMIFAQLQAALNQIFKSSVIPSKTLTFKTQVHLFLTRRFVCFAMILAFIGISIVSMLLSGFLSLIVQDRFAEAMKVIHHAGVFVVYGGLFSILFRWMPDSRPNWTSALTGGFLTSFLFIAGKILIGIYIGHTAVGSMYGAAGSLVVLLIWAFYSSLIILFGAEIASQLCGEDCFEPTRRTRRERLMA